MKLTVWRHGLAVVAICAVIALSGAFSLPLQAKSMKPMFLIGLLPVAGNIFVFAAHLGSGVASSSLIPALSTSISTLTMFCWGIVLHMS